MEGVDNADHPLIVSWAFDRTAIMDENEVFENYHFILAKRLLIVMGIWPYQNKTQKFYRRALIIVAIHSVIIPQIIRFHEEWYEDNRNEQILIENFASFLYIQVVLSKLYTSILKEKTLQHLYEIITRDYKEIQDPEERAAMDKLWSIARIIGIVYSSYMFIALFVFVFTPQVVPTILDAIRPMNESRPKVICFYAEYFIDQEKYLYQLIAHTFVCVLMMLLIACAVDTSYISTTYHVLGYFNLLECRLKKMNEWINNINGNNEQLHNFVIDTIKIHKKTLYFAETVRFTYNGNQFFTVGLSIAFLAIGTIEVLANITDPEVILRVGVVWVGMIAYLFFVNWPGQCFLDAGDNLMQLIYDSYWYKLPKKTQFLLRFMMMRCQIPCQLTAGPLIQMNFASWGAILRTAMSYFTAVTSLS